MEFGRFLPQLIRLSRRAEISRRVVTRLLACSRARLRNGLSWVDHITDSSIRPVDISYMISFIFRSLWPFRTPISSLPKSESLQRWRQACFYQISITLFLDLDQLWYINRTQSISGFLHPPNYTFLSYVLLWKLESSGQQGTTTLPRRFARGPTGMHDRWRWLNNNEQVPLNLPAILKVVIGRWFSDLRENYTIVMELYA